MIRRKVLKGIAVAPLTAFASSAEAEEIAVTCRNCDGDGWVCENHEDRPWYGTSKRDDACDCGAGSPCPVCNKKMAFSGMAFDILDAVKDRYPMIKTPELYALLSKVRA